VELLKTLAEAGVADLGEYWVGTSAAEVAQRIASALSCKVWRPPELLSANPIASKPLNTYGGNFGLGPLPLHTDLAHWHVPPRYLMLRCAIGDPAVETPLVHHTEALRGLPASVIDRALFRPRRRLEGQMFFVRLRHRGIFRWDRLFLVPENAEAREAYAALVECQPSAGGNSLILDRPGRTIVIDNWATLHGRSAVTNPASRRRIERAYFSGIEDDQ
jgi:alpha-ketoglutarate-dependent taurine dioxygenase